VGVAGTERSIDDVSMTIDSDAPQSLPDVLQRIWELLMQGVANRRHAFHHPVVATLGADGTPKSRVVILRSADESCKTVRFHTDTRSEKWRELQSSSSISMTFYDEIERVQVRAEGKADLQTDNDLAQEAWGKSLPMSRVCYGTSPGPGVPVEQGDDYTLPDQLNAAEGYCNFGVIVVNIFRLEWLCLRQASNRRALFDFQNNTAQWLVP
jgi:pyridoxamine 5'-phosphate oxidase